MRELKRLREEKGAKTSFAAVIRLEETDLGRLTP
jgi:hypothetical protein